MTPGAITAIVARGLAPLAVRAEGAVGHHVFATPSWVAGTFATTARRAAALTAGSSVVRMV